MGTQTSAATAGAIVMLGCFDTKGDDFSYLWDLLINEGFRVLAVNTGIRGSTDRFPVDVEAGQVAAAAGVTLEMLRERGDRGMAVARMGQGAAAILAELVQGGDVAGVIGMGGGGGTHMVLTAMRRLPFGIPKVCVSTLATQDLSMQVGSADIVLVPSVVDIAGPNSISRITIGYGASAIAGMAAWRVRQKAVASVTPRRRVAISMFGNTTACVDVCCELLKERGFEAIPFHANGTGGRTMESLIAEGYFDGVLDITTTELADDLCGGVCSAGPERLTAAAQQGIPQVVVPGCLDMVNFDAVDRVPVTYRDRQLYSWSPMVTLMRTNLEENRILGRLLAEKVSAAPSGTTVVLLPLGGLSQLDAPGGPFYVPEADKALFDALRWGLPRHVQLLESPRHINDPAFAAVAVDTLVELLKYDKTKETE